MKFTKVTKENLHLILFRVNQLLQRNEVMTSFSDWGRFPKQMNRMGIKYIKDDVFGDRDFVERSTTTHILKSEYSIRLDYDYGIVIHVMQDCTIAIELGFKIRITPYQIIVKGVNRMLNQSFTEYITPSSNIKKALENHSHNQMMADMYWAEVENEHNQEEAEREIQDLTDGGLVL